MLTDEEVTSALATKAEKEPEAEVVLRWYQQRLHVQHEQQTQKGNGRGRIGTSAPCQKLSPGASQTQNCPLVCCFESGGKRAATSQWLVNIHVLRCNFHPNGGSVRRPMYAHATRNNDARNPLNCKFPWASRKHGL